VVDYQCRDAGVLGNAGYRAVDAINLARHGLVRLMEEVFGLTVAALELREVHAEERRVVTVKAEKCTNGRMLLGCICKEAFVIDPHPGVESLVRAIRAAVIRRFGSFRKLVVEVVFEGFQVTRVLGFHGSSFRR